MDISGMSSLFDPLRKFSKDKGYPSYFDEHTETEYLISCLSQRFDDDDMVFVETFIHALLIRDKEANINGYNAQVWLGFNRSSAFLNFCTMHLLKQEGFYGDDEVDKITVKGFRHLASRVRTSRGIKTFNRILELEKCVEDYALDIADRVKHMTAQLDAARAS
jgi:hypothetical protein